MSKSTFKKYADSLLIAEEGKRHYVAIKHYNTFVYDHTLTTWKKTFLLFLFTGF